MQFLCELFMKLFKNWSVYGGGMSYASYIKRVLSCDFQIILKNRNIDGGGGECNFSLTILKESCLLLQLSINFTHTIDARTDKHACMVSLKHCDCGNMFEICLQPPIFDIIQISVILPKNVISL